jgi:tetratricopeptide (TPR) repeat protein
MRASCGHALFCCAVVAALMLLPRPSSAQTQRDLNTCKNFQADPDQTIRACNVFIATGRAVGGGRPLPIGALAGIRELRALAYERKGDHEHALIDHNESIKLHSNAESHNNRGNTYFSLGNYDQALADYNEALRIDPKYALAVQNHANLEYRKEIDGQWRRYLKEIQDENDYANWSGPPLDRYWSADK